MPCIGWAAMPGFPHLLVEEIEAVVGRERARMNENRREDAEAK